METVTKHPSRVRVPPRSPDTAREANRDAVAAIFDAAPAALMLVDERLEVLRVNRAMQAGFMGRVAPRDHRWGALLRCVHALAEEPGCGSSRCCDACPIRRAVVEALETGVSSAGEWSVGTVGDDGAAGTVWVQYGIEPIELSEGRCALLSLADVTELKELEERYLHAQKMEAVGRLAGGMAHDFNNLLAVIVGFGNLLLEGGRDEAFNKSAAGGIIAAGQKASSLTRQLLAFSRRETRKPQLLKVGEVVSGIAPMLKPLLGEEIGLVTECAAEPGWVVADRGHLEQVIMNLAVNARDAMPSGGVLAIATRAEDLERDAAPTGEIEPGRYLVLTVSDTGEGMEPATLARAFEPFFTTKEPGKGTGLGLATVYRIVRQTGGAVRIHSDPGIGTTVKILLPLERDERTAKENEKGHAIGEGR